MMELDDFFGCLDRPPVYGNEYIARTDAGTIAGRARRHLTRGEAFGSAIPEHAIFDLVPLHPHRNVRSAKRNEHDDDNEREHRTCPCAPAVLAARYCERDYGHLQLWVITSLNCKRDKVFERPVVQPHATNPREWIPSADQHASRGG